MRVVIVEDQVLLREGLASLFADGGHEVVATQGDAEGLLAVVELVAPDLVVLDVRMPPTHTDEGIRAAAELKAAHPTLGVLVLSQHVETVHSVGLIEYRAFGYLLKDRVLEVGESWRPASEWPEVARRSIRKSYPTSSLVASAPGAVRGVSESSRSSDSWRRV